MYLKFKILFLSLVPVAIALAVAFFFVRFQAEQLVQQQVAALEEQIVEEKRQELRNYTELALASIEPFLLDDTASASDRAFAAAQIVQILGNLTYAKDGYFFVYEQDGTNVLHPTQPWRVGENWWDVQDPDGVYLIRDLIYAAQNGGGFVPYMWERPSTSQTARKLGYAVMVDQFDWMVGTGVYLDEIDGLMATIRANVERQVDRIFVIILLIFALCVMGVGVFITVLAYRETSFADAKLRELYNELVDVQEDERARVSRDLHDGISQILVSAKYAIALAKTRLEKRHPDEDVPLDDGFARIDDAIQEVRRISSDLRPKALDDLGLAAALTSLGARFQKATGIPTHVTVSPAKDCLSPDQKSALYRIAQEALTNIERHADASEVKITLSREKRGIALVVADNGRGMRANTRTAHHAYRGIGIRNMEERMAAYSGHLSIQPPGNGASGTSLVATMPFGAQDRGTAP